MTDQALRNTLKIYLLVSVAEFVSFMVQSLDGLQQFSKDSLRMNLNFVRFWTE